MVHEDALIFQNKCSDLHTWLKRCPGASLEELESRLADVQQEQKNLTRLRNHAEQHERKRKQAMTSLEHAVKAFVAERVKNPTCRTPRSKDFPGGSMVRNAIVVFFRICFQVLDDDLVKNNAFEFREMCLKMLQWLEENSLAPREEFTSRSADLDKRYKTLLRLREEARKEAEAAEARRLAALNELLKDLNDVFNCQVSIRIDNISIESRHYKAQITELL